MKTMQLHMRVWISLFFLAAACSLSAQQFTGRVTDKTGAVIPKVTVTAHNVDTNVDITATTNETGSYTIPFLKAGNYTVIAECKGFKKATHEGINLQVSQISVVNFALNVGNATETVTVVGDTMLDRGKADIGEVVENDRVTELPLNGRDPMMLSVMVAGVQTSATGTGYTTRPFDDTQKYTSVNGGGTGNVALLLDGMDNSTAPINITGGTTEGLARTGYTTPIDSVQEFKMVTSPYDSQYGLMAGGVEDVILKSGTNKLHGDMYEFARRTFLDANTWQNKYYLSKGGSASSYKRPESKWDQYGFELDGPVNIPKLYNGKNKTFFTIQWEHFHALSPLTDVASVPDPVWADGDFSTLDYWTSGGYVKKQIYDPLTGVKNSSGVYVRDQFPNNKIPAGQINATAQKILKMYPTPNVTITSGQDRTIGNYVLSTSGVDTYDNALVKLDENWSKSDRFSLRYGYWMWNNTYNSNGMPAPLSRGQTPIIKRSHTFALEETHTFNPNLLFDFKANVLVRNEVSRTGSAYDMKNLGWTQSQIDSMGTAVSGGGGEFPRTCWQDSVYGCYYSSYTTVGSSDNTGAVKNSMSLLPTIMWIKGTHTIKAGLDLRFWQNGYTLMNGGPTINTGSSWTYQTANHAVYSATDGNTFASYLLGVPWSATNQIWPKTYQSQHYMAPFVQDDWKVTKNLTLNIGLRWDFMPGEHDRQNRGNYAFDTVTQNPYTSGVNLTEYGHGALVGGITFLGVNGNPTAGYRTQHFNWQPRFGFAYSLNNKTVIRGGFGKSMRAGATNNGINVLGFSASTTGVTSNSAYPSGVFPNMTNTLDSLFWGGLTDSVLQPTGSSLGLGTNLGQSTNYLNPSYKVPSFWSYSLGFQRQLTKNSSLQASWVGSRLYDGESTGNINLQSKSYRAACNPINGGNIRNCDGTNNTVTNPFYGISQFSGSGYNTSTTINEMNLTRPMPQFQDVTEYLQNDARTWYNSLQVTVMQKLTKSMTLHATWTWSKSMSAGTWDDQYNGVRYRTVDSADIPHRLTLSGVYTLPFGRGHMFFSRVNRIVDEAISGWELSSMAVIQSGVPQAVPGYYLHNAKVNRHVQSNNGYIRVFAPYAEYWKLDSTTDKYVLAQYKDTATNGLYDYDGSVPASANFMEVPSYAPAAMTEYSGIREAGFRQFDASFSKNFDIYNGMKLQLRLDTFNLLNHPEWTGAANTTTSSANLGMITKGTTGSSVDPRRMQLSAKVVW